MGLDEWQEICKENGVSYVKKGTPQYELVKSIYDQRYPSLSIRKESPVSETIPSNWTLACREAGVKIARRGTPEYDTVMGIFREMK
jgi:hypothetical protein